MAELEKQKGALQYDLDNHNQVKQDQQQAQRQLDELNNKYRQLRDRYDLVDMLSR